MCKTWCIYIFQSVILKNGSDVFKAWVNPPIPVYFEIRLFHVANKEAVLVNGSKPIVVEKGPYVYL